MMTEITIIATNETLPIREYQGQRVVTLADIDRVHRRPVGTARRNFNENRHRFIENVDYFEVVAPDIIRTLGIERPQGGTPSKLILLTLSGYLMVVKSLTDDLAWQVQRFLMRAYFAVQDGAPVAPHVNASTLKSLAMALRATVKVLPHDTDSWPVVREIYAAAGIAVPERLEHVSPQTTSDADLRQTLRQLGSWAYAHTEEFMGRRTDTEHPPLHWLGQWKRVSHGHARPDELCVYTHVLERLLEDWGYRPEIVINGWYAQGWLRRDSDGRHRLPHIVIAQGSDAGQRKRVFYVLSRTGRAIALK